MLVSINSTFPCKKLKFLVPLSIYFVEDKFTEVLQSVPWDTIILFDNTDYVMEAWLHLFLQVVDKHIPKKQHTIWVKQKQNQPQWLS